MNKISDFIHNNKVYSKCCYSEQLEIDDELKRIEMLERENKALSIEGEEKCEKLEQQAKEIKQKDERIADLTNYIKELEKKLFKK